MNGKMFVLKDKQQNHPQDHAKNDTNADSLPPLISDVIADSKHYYRQLICRHLEATEIEFTDHRIRLHKEELNRNNGSGACIAVVEMGQHVINRDVFQAGPGNNFRCQKIRENNKKQL